jgi:hypothetical protein
MVKVILIAGVAYLYVWNIRRVSRFERDYKYEGIFSGKQYDCRVGGFSEDRGTLCFLGADASGLYLLPHPKPAFSLWRRRDVVFKKALFIPWTDLGYRSAKVLFKDSVWFELSARKVYFYVPRDVGEKLLNDAGRGIPL